jgi:hypothetical protein
MSNQPGQPTRPANPFASSLPRLSSSSNAPQPAPAAPQPTQQPTPPARPSPLASRLGPPKTNWRIVPASTHLVRFDLNGLGDPFHRLLGKKLALDMGDPSAAIKALEAGGDDVAEMKVRLEAAWQDYAFKGAILLYNWRKDTRNVLAGRVPTADDSESEELYDEEKRTPPIVMRALDLWLVLNVLARTRANILLPDAPLVLEGQYLSRSLFSNDPRLLALALATGCIEESVLK